MDKAKSYNPKLETYVHLVDFLGAFLGKNYEIILHDLTRIPNTIISIKNNEISNRKVGGPITNSALKMIQDKVYLKKEFLINYKGMIGNKTLRSATMFIRDGEEVIGLLCINFDDSNITKALEQVMNTIHPEDWLESNRVISYEEDNDGSDEDNSVEEYYASIDELMEHILNEAMKGITIPKEYMKPEDRMEVIEQLYSKGMFQMKNAIPYVAENLDCSHATVYRYLQNIRNNQELV